MSMHKHDPSQPNVPWWRVGMVWLVLAGPLVVVVAGIATAVLAVRNADPPVAVKAAPADGSDQAAAPALQARNHAAAPLRPSR